MPVGPGENKTKPYIRVRHAELPRDSDSPYKSTCPACSTGILLMRRNDAGTLLAYDLCTLCGQKVLYTDSEVAGEPVILGLPATLDEAIQVIDRVVQPEDRKRIIEGGETPDELAYSIHHTFGRYLRNSLELWQNSPIANWLRTKRGIHHPDDMSHALIVEYIQHVRPARTVLNVVEDNLLDDGVEEE